MASFVHRIMGAAMLDVDTYEEVEADRTATPQAFLVVIASSVCTGLGLTGWGARAWSDVLVVSVVALIGWGAWAVLTLEIGGRLLPTPETKVDVTELLRTNGFAAAHGLMRILGIFPALTTPVFVLTAAWMLASTVVAVRQALDYSSLMRALGVCVLGWALTTACIVVAGLWLAPPLY